MREFGTDQRVAAAEPKENGQLSPALLAERVGMIVSDEPEISARALPMWDRIVERRPRTWLSRLARVAAWGVTAGLLAVAALRVWFHDAAVPLVWLNAFTLYVYLPAYVVLAIAAWRRRSCLAAASAAVVACHLTWIAPDFQPATPYESPLASDSETAPSLRIFYANVRMGNLDVGGVLREAARVDPDVIVLAEMHRWWFQQIPKSPLIARYRFGTNLSRRHRGDVVVFSRLPVRRQQLITAEERVCNVVDIPLGSETLRLFCLHAPRPVFEPHNHYVAFWQKIEPILAEQLEPLVAIGDFNATQHSRLCVQLTSGRLRTAHVDRGRGYATTWPNGQVPLPPIRIDHALISPQVECLSIVEGVGMGSDHKPLILDVRVHASGRASESAAAGR